MRLLHADEEHDDSPASALVDFVRKCEKLGKFSWTGSEVVHSL